MLLLGKSLTFEERLMPIARAELCALLKAIAENMDPEVAAHRAELEAAVQAELEEQHRTSYGAFA